MSDEQRKPAIAGPADDAFGADIDEDVLWVPPHTPYRTEETCRKCGGSYHVVDLADGLCRACGGTQPPTDEQRFSRQLDRLFGPVGTDEAVAFCKYLDDVEAELWGYFDLAAAEYLAAHPERERNVEDFRWSVKRALNWPRFKLLTAVADCVFYPDGTPAKGYRAEPTYE